MADNLHKIISVFIGSPGGLEKERLAAKKIFEEVNSDHADHWGCQFRLVGWEATLPRYNRAQTLINEDLDKCDYFIGILWDRWGTPTDSVDSRYSSGFEEEYERAKLRVEQGLMKDISLYFKEIDESKLKDPGPSLTKVLSFRDE